MSQHPSDSSVSADLAAVPPLLGPDDPPPFEVVNAEGRRPLVLICDHASRAVPSRLGRLGLEDWVFERHVAWDIGAAGLTRLLAERLDAPAVLGGYSRLVVDVNRQPGHPGSIPVVSDGIAVPGNASLSAREAQARLDALFWPYHRCVGDLLAGHWVRQAKPPVLFSIHSFTPCLADGGTPRPWHAGVLWNRDPRVALPLIDALREEPGLMVGDNEPYSGRTSGYSVEMHAGAAGLPYAAIEVRQDLIADDSGVAAWADRLGRALETVLDRPDLHSVRHY